MTQNPHAVDIALRYHHAWTAGDMDTAMTYLAPDVSFDGPAGALDGAAAVRQFMEPFARTVTSVQLLAAHGSDHDALVLYDTGTAAVPSAPAAEWYRVEAGRITAGRIVFDRLPFALARGDVVPRSS